MRIIVRINQDLLVHVEKDLARPHSFAEERLGFLHARWAWAGDALLIFPYGYMPVLDDNYIEDPTVGAKMNSAAIRAALQASLDTGAAFLHVHLHSSGMPYFGSLDLREQDKLIPSFKATTRDAPHGAVLLFGTGALARIWPPGHIDPINAQQVTVVGWPMRIYRHDA